LNLKKVATQHSLFLYPFDFQFDKVELKIKRRGIVSLSPSCTTLTGGYSNLATPWHKIVFQQTLTWTSQNQKGRTQIKQIPQIFANKG